MLSEIILVITVSLSLSQKSILALVRTHNYQVVRDLFVYVQWIRAFYWTFQCLDLLICTIKIIILINITWVIVRVKRVNVYTVQRLVTVDIITVVICLPCRYSFRARSQFY